MTERIVLQFGVGAACLSMLVFALCAAGLATPVSLGACALLVLAANFYKPLPRGPGERLHSALFWAVSAPFAVVYIVNALAPEISPDGAYYHLGLVRRYLEHGGFYSITNNFYANFSQGCEMLFLAAYSLGRHSAAAMVHCLFLLALPAAIVAYGQRFGLQRAAVAAALVVFVAPVVGIDGTSAYVDVALAFTGFACFYALEIWESDPNDTLPLEIAGLLAGFCFAIKYTGIVTAIYASLFVLVRSRAIGVKAFRSLTVLLLPVAVLSVPWMVKNWIFVSNPVSPFFNRLFPNPYVHISFENALRESMRHFGGFRLDWHTPIELTVGGGIVQGTLGPAFLLAPLGLLALKDARGRRFLGAALLFGLPWFSNAGSRFLIPALPFIALAMCLVMARWGRTITFFVMLNAFACWPWFLSTYCASSSWRLTRFPIYAALRMVPEQDFINTYAPEVRFARLLQDKAPEDAVIYTAQPVMTSYTDREVMLNFAAALNERLSDVLAAAIQPPLQPTVRVSFTFSPLVVEKLRIVATGDAAMWTIHEFDQLKSDGDQGALATTVEPNLWDLPQAVDGALATSWRSWQPVRNGMYVEAVPRAATSPIGSVAFRTRPGEAPPPMRLDAQLPSGEWRTISTAPTLEAVPVTATLRSEAVEELRRCGVTHLLIHDQEPLGPDFKAHLGEWRVRLLGEAAPVRLYEIQPAETIDTQQEVRNNTR